MVSGGLQLSRKWGLEFSRVWDEMSDVQAFKRAEAASGVSNGPGPCRCIVQAPPGNSLDPVSVMVT